MTNTLRHITSFCATQYRNLGVFNLMILSEDRDIDFVIREHVKSATMLELTSPLSPREITDNTIAIIDCRQNFPDPVKTDLPDPVNTHPKLALIEPAPNCRINAFASGFSDFLSWPITTPELSVRILGQCHAFCRQEPAYKYSRIKLVEQCCTYIIEHIDQPLSVQMLAKTFNSNHNTLTTFFKRETGLPPIAWQRKMRMEAAARQLILTDSPITEIAGDFGYDVPGNFTTAFRRHFGLSPYNYRKQLISQSF